MSIYNKSVIPRVKRAAYQKLRDLSLQNNGIIFGGFVRDEFIKEYYTSEYNKNNIGENNIDKYWDPRYMPSTSARTIIPDDMDVCFNNTEDAENFINCIKKTTEYSNIIMKDMGASARYYTPMILSVRELTIQIIIGAIPFVNEGTIITIKADIVIPKYKHLEPPFKNLDMLCNAFIIKKDGSKVLSKHTGTIIDSYSDYERTMVTAQILKDLKDFKTVLSFNTNTANYRFILNIVAMKRLLKMHNKKFKWTFINMPFKITNYKEDLYETKECCICKNIFNNDDKLAYTESAKEETMIPCSFMHYNCCMKYLKYQMMNAPHYHTRKFVFQCPFRNEINFTRCSLDIQSVYMLEI